MAELTDKQIRAIPIILTSQKISHGCKKAGVGLSTFYKWKENPAFLAEYEKQRRALIQEAYTILERSIEKAAHKLVGLLDSDDERLTRLAAVNIIELHAKHITSEELEQRIIELENRISKVDTGD